uniref:Uncharacterized protein n=1 Tax=Lygus hesperus TaxID=30085 RepID=A0A146LGM1_LYGHE
MGRSSSFFVPTHVGHDFALSRLHLDEQYRAELAAKIMLNIPMDSILDAERQISRGSAEGIEDEDQCIVEMKRSHLVTRKALHNIAHEFHVNKDIIRHKNDAVSVQSWIKIKEGPGSTHSLEVVRAKLNKVLDNVEPDNSGQIDALYEQVNQIEALMRSLAKKPSTAGEAMPPLPEAAVSSKKKLTPQKRFLVIETRKKKASDDLTTPTVEKKKKMSLIILKRKL